MIGDNSFLPKNQNTTEKKEKDMQIQTGQFFDEKTLRDILILEERSFPPETAYNKEYYKEALQNERFINVILRKEGRVIGYMLAIPQPEAINDLKEDDSELIEDPECIYIETIEIDPDLLKGLAGGRIFVEIIEKGIGEAIQRGYKRFCAHVRKSVSLHTAVKKYLGEQIIKTREISKWKWVANEPYEYIEGNLKLKEKK